MNRSRPSQRQLVKWYLSGAIRWQPEIPEGSRIIGVAYCYKFGKIFSEIAICKATLSSDGQRLSLNLNGGTHCFVVPVHERYVFGVTIERIPGNAIPVDVFFGKD